MNNELTAALLTIEKCRELSGCPAGVDLQDWVKQLAEENVALKEYRPEPYGIAIMEALDAFFADDEVPERAMMAAFEILCAKRMPAPATDRIVAGIKADGVALAKSAFEMHIQSPSCYQDEMVGMESALSIACQVESHLREGADK